MDKEKVLREQMQAQRQMLEDALKELKEQNSELQKALDKLKKRNQELAEIAYQTSHDMRGPVATLQGLANLMSLEDDPELAKSLISEVPKLLAKVDTFSKSLSDFTRVVSKPVEPQEIDWKTLLKKTITSKEMQEKTRIAIEAKYKFYSDSLRIETILKHLIGNAYLFNRHLNNLVIEVKVLVEDNFAELEITDNGIGIDDSVEERVFNMFYRGSLQSTGSGIGLYLVKTAVDDLQGKISLTNNSQSQGASFSVSLPQLEIPVKLPSFDF